MSTFCYILALFNGATLAIEEWTCLFTKHELNSRSVISAVLFVGFSIIAKQYQQEKEIECDF